MTHMTQNGHFNPPRQKHDQCFGPKCTQPDLAGKWPVPNWGNYVQSLVLVHFVPCFPSADGSVVLGKLTQVHNGRGGGGGTK